MHTNGGTRSWNATALVVSGLVGCTSAGESVVTEASSTSGTTETSTAMSGATHGAQSETTEHHDAVANGGAGAGASMSSAAPGEGVGTPAPDDGAPPSDSSMDGPTPPNPNGSGSGTTLPGVDDGPVAAGGTSSMSDDPVAAGGVNANGVPATSDGGVANAVDFERIELSAEFLAEGANGGDFDRDGVMDVVAGPYWYRGPDFSSRHLLYLSDGQVEPEPFDVRNYSDHFFSFVDDFNADGWPDVLVINFPGREARWYQNPQTPDMLWPVHPVFDSVGNESPAFVDLDGDGQRELVFSSDGALGWAQPSTTATDPWTFQALTPAAGAGPYDHGLGVSDVDGDGDLDLLGPTGFWEQPNSDAEALWVHHEHTFGNGGAQMFAYDIDGDGDQDVVTTLAAHEYGVGWYERTGEAASPRYTLHLISPEQPGPDSLFQPHALHVVDMNGDGLLDLVTGERFWAHVPEGDPSFDEPAKLVWYELRRNPDGVEFVPHVVDDDSGVGTQVVAMDLNADERPDIVVASKKGAFVFIQTAK